MHTFPATKGPFSIRTGLVGSPVICLGLHAGEQGDLRRHLLEQVMVDRRPGMFQLREINQMERVMCQYLEWELNVDPVTLKEFEEMVRKDFVGIGPYPTYILPSTKKSTPPPSAIPFHPTCGVSPSPSNEQRYTSPPKVPYVPSPPSYSSPPETPSSCYSTSPASSASPPTPLVSRTPRPRSS